MEKILLICFWVLFHYNLYFAFSTVSISFETKDTLLLKKKILNFVFAVSVIQGMEQEKGLVLMEVLGFSWTLSASQLLLASREGRGGVIWLKVSICLEYATVN